MVKEVSPHKDLCELSMFDDHLWRLEVKPKNIYVASSLHNQLAAAVLSLKLQDAGFTVTSRWVRKNFTNMPSKEKWSEYNVLKKEMGRINVEDLERSDTLIILADVPSSSGGFHVELGYFLGAKKSNILVVGDRPNVFFWTANVRWTSEADHLVEWLLHQSHGDISNDGSDRKNNFKKVPRQASSRKTT